MASHTATRSRVLGAARASPYATSAQIAAAAGCHRDTASRHLRQSLTARPPRPSAAVPTAAGPQELRLASSRSRSGIDRRLLNDAATGGVHDRHAVAARNPRCAPSTLRMLAAGHAADVRAAAAQNPEPSAALLASAVHGRDAGVRSAAISHRRCPPRVLARAASDPDAAMRSAVAANPNCPPRVLALLGGDRHRLVRYMAADRL